MALSHVIADLRRDPGFMSHVTAWQTLPAQPARTAPIPKSLHPALIGALAHRDIPTLYTHQRQAVDQALQGANVAVVTPTASGKTLCYNLPVLHALLTDPEATALYLFPTKALAQDQLAELRAWRRQLLAQDPTLATRLPQGGVATYDGDTPRGRRPRIREEARLLITNPDMLHLGILPYHGNWARFFAHLRFVVLDEMHTYRGIFGSHVANLLRRLQRIARFHGGRPQFILTSATIANPQELAEKLIEQPVRLVDDNGAPRGEKHILLTTPPLYDPERGLRRSSVLVAQELAARFLLGGVQTIVFARSRLTVEVLLTYLRERLSRSPRRGSRSSQGGSLPPEAIRGYRGGYLPEERRAIEAGLRQGKVRGVVATNALELGIDIGQLEAAILCGYPGSIASTWQQMGRAGRSRNASLALLVASASALDQYILNHPEFLLERSPEHALIHPDNLMLLVDQLRCAAFELPFSAGEGFGRSPFTEEVLALLAEQGELYAHAGRFLWSGESYPARRVSLRSASGEPVTIQARTEEGVRAIGQVDRASAPRLVHEGAIYIHEGQSYLVESLDLEEDLARVRPARVDYYTQAGTETAIQVLGIREEAQVGGGLVAHGELQVTSRVVEYRRVKHFTHENLGVTPLDYPPQLLETDGYWFRLTAQALAELAAAGQWQDAPNDYGPNWQEQRAKVRARDGYRCAVCGKPEPPDGQHDVHHLRPFRSFGYVPGHNEHYREANRLSNLMLVCRTCHRRLEAGVRTRGGLAGLATILGNLAPLFLMCDRSDIGVTVEERSQAGGEEAGSPRIFVYEGIPAGLGFSQQLFQRHRELLAAAQETIQRCGCRYGCPACVGPVLENDPAGEGPLLETKQLTLSLIQALLGAG